jgi:hypothetical protein
MRAGLLRATATPAPAPARARRWRPVAAAAACLAVTAAVATVALDRDDPRTLAYSGGTVSPEVRRAAEQCLADNRAHAADPPIGDDLTLVNLLGRDRDAAVVYTSPRGIVYCFNTPGTESRSIARTAVTNWLPGPVHIGSGESTTIEGTSDHVALAGRISARANRVVLDHGNGGRTRAHLAGGTFTLIADGPVEITAATLLTYDGAGTEIDRRPAWPAEGLSRQTSTCYTEPAGTVVDGSVAGTGCRPAEPWR